MSENIWKDGAKVYIAVLEELRARSETDAALKAVLSDVWQAFTPSLFDDREARTFKDRPPGRENCETCGGNWHGDKAFEYGFAAGVATASRRRDGGCQ